MHPGVPHYVYGVENTIIHGSHFYCASQMQATVESLVHTFILSNFILNTFHHPSCELLCRIVIFWALGLLQHPFSANSIIGACFSFHFLINTSDDEHLHLPNVQTFQGLITTRAQLQLWKDFDWNDIPGDECMAICYAHGVALAIFGWICDWCIVKTLDGEVVEDLPSKYLVNLLDALVGYKDKAKAQGLEGAPHCAP